METKPTPIISKLSNASFGGLRNNGYATVAFQGDENQFVIAGFTPEKLEDLEQAFNIFVARFRDACDGINTRRSLKEAHEVFEEKVIPALEQAGVKVTDCKNYVHATLLLQGASDGTMQVGDKLLPLAEVIINLPLRKGIRKIWNNSVYDAHARFEETLHLLQFLNEGPLTAMGLTVKQALIDRDPSLMQRLTKNLKGFEAEGRFVRENDIMVVYEECGISLPGIFLFPYDRRAVAQFILTKNPSQAA